MEPRPLHGPLLRTVAALGRAPLAGPGIRAAAVAMLGVRRLRDARLGRDVRPFDVHALLADHALADQDLAGGAERR